MVPSPNLSRSRSLRVGLLVALVLVLTMGGTWAIKEGLRANGPVPTNGVVDLRAWDFSRDGLVVLGGTWEFLPEALVSGDELSSHVGMIFRAVPDTRFGKDGGFFQGTGGGTYRLRLLVSEGQSSLGLRLSTVWTAYEVEINGTILARIGSPSADPAREVAALEAVLLPLPPNSPSIEVVVRVSNHQFRWGGIVTPPEVGPWNTLVQRQKLNDIAIYLLVGALAGAALFALFFFGFRRTDPAFISFAVFALLMVVRSLTTGDRLLTQLVPGLSFDAFVRIQYLSLYLLIPSATVFFATLFPKDVGPIEFKVYLGVSLLPTVLIPWAPLFILSWQILSFLVLGVGLVGYAYWVVCLRTMLNGRPGAPVMLVAGTFLLGILVMSIRDQVVLAQAESGFPLGIAAIVLAQAMVLAFRSTWALAQTEKLTVELKQSNRALAAETREAEEARTEVERSLKEKDVLLKEVHHRVKNSLQIVLSIIGLETRRTKNPEVQQAYRGVRDRIRAISLVHNRLYGLESEHQVNLGEYLAELTSRLEESSGGARVHFEAPETILLPMDYCLDVGLVVTELVNNSWQGEAVVQIKVRPEVPGFCLEISNPGPGFPEQTEDAPASAGLKVVSSLIKGRKGEVRVPKGQETRTTIFFPTTPSENR